MICSGLKCLLPFFVLLDSSESLSHLAESFQEVRSVCPLSEAVLIASQIPNAQFVQPESRNHINRCDG